MVQTQDPQNVRRQINVSVVGRNQIPLAGSRIVFSTNGNIVGIIDPSNGAASISLPDPMTVIDIEATYQNAVGRASVPPNQHTLTVTLDVIEPLFKSYIPTKAECPDGSTGQPCVVCVVGGKPYEICA